MSLDAEPSAGRHRYPTEEGILLATIPPGRDLDGYMFESLTHAITWLTACQSYTQTHYKVALVTFKRRPCCGAISAVQRHRTMSVEQFLTEYAPPQGAEGQPDDTLRP